MTIEFAPAAGLRQYQMSPVPTMPVVAGYRARVNLSLAESVIPASWPPVKSLASTTTRALPAATAGMEIVWTPVPIFAFVVRWTIEKAIFQPQGFVEQKVTSARRFGTRLPKLARGMSSQTP